MRVAVHQGGVETDLCHDVAHHVALVLARLQPVDGQSFGDDLGHGHARRQGTIGVLEYDLHIGAQRPHLVLVQRVDVTVQKADAPFRADQAHDCQRQRGFARPAFADNAKRLAGAHLQGRGIDRLDMTHRALEKPCVDREPDLQRVGFGDDFGAFRHRRGHARRFSGQ